MEPIERIDRYLDNLLTDEQTARFEQELALDADFRATFNSVRMAREAVKTVALRARIGRLHQQFMPDLPPLDGPADEPHHQNAPVIPLRSVRKPGWVLRVAASVLLVLTGYGAYQYNTIGADSFYAANYVQYQLPTTRSASAAQTRLANLYADADFPAVTRAFTQLANPGPKDYFLAAQAHLHQKQFDPAIERFTALRQQSGGFYAQETDYYLALAYVGAGRSAEAYPLFAKIRQSPRHLYHRSVTDQDLWRLRLLEYKK